ncbi:MAG TPA: hypothetical protein VL123_08185 [Candidatus Udaeobacter sp.]|jgi:hypothetical protein|nr:hypothetical protein [Candidatus Udaeobacter sp.]
MPRFIFKRWWALILALAIVTALTSTSSRPAVADTASGTGYLDGGGGDAGGGGGTSIGDPDVPTSPGKGKVGRMVWTAPGGAAVSVGDGNAPNSVRVIGLRVLLQSLMVRWFGI